MEKEKLSKIQENQNKIMSELRNEIIEHNNSTEDIDMAIKDNILKPMMFLDPLRSNRFIVSFDKEYNIPPYSVHSIMMPTVNKNNCGDTIINFRKIDTEISKAIYAISKKKNFSFIIDFLDSAGKPVETFIVKVKKVKSINFGGYMSYEDDSVSEIRVVFKTKKCTLI